MNTPCKYFRNGKFLNVKLGNNPSFTWKSIWSTQPILVKGCRWHVGDGTNFTMWEDAWLKEDDDFRIATPLIPGLESV